MTDKNFEKRPVTLKTGSEPLSTTGKTLLDFWKWNSSDLVSNTTRGRFAEFIVASALNIDLTIPRDEWSAWDLTSPEGIKIEVKSAAYLQSWSQSGLSKISFSIRPARAWNGNSGEFAAAPGRQSDIYVFCLLKHQDKETLDPLNLDQWEFYAVLTSAINEQYPESVSVTLNSLQRLSRSVRYRDLRREVLREAGK
jgi:hypothetical protein